MKIVYWLLLALLVLGALAWWLHKKSSEQQDLPAESLEPTTKTTEEPKKEPVKTEHKTQSKPIHSRFGFKPGQKLWLKTSIANVYAEPDPREKNIITTIYLDHENYHVKFIQDANTDKMLFKGQVAFTDKNGNRKVVTGYMIGKNFTNIEP